MYPAGAIEAIAPAVFLYAGKEKPMTRPFAVSGLTLFFVMLALSFFQTPLAAVVAGAVCFALFLWTVLYRKTRVAGTLPTVCFSALLGCLLLLSFHALQRQPALSFAGTRDVLLCEAQDYPVPSSTGKRLHVTAKVTLENGTRIPGYVQLSLPRYEDSAAAVEPGDTIRFTGTLFALGGENAGAVRTFHSRRLFLGANPILNLSVAKATSVSPYHRLLRWRQRLIQTLGRTFEPEQASFLTAVLFGEKSTMPDALYTAFRRAGAAHIMAVSGLHLSAWIFFLLSVWKKRTQDLRRVGLVLSAATVLLMALAAFSGSVLRAGLMMLVYLFGLVLRRNADGVNSLGFACLAVLCVCPAFCFHVGFTLSVLSTLAILTVALPLTDRCRQRIDARVQNPALRSAANLCTASAVISVCVTAVTLPVQIGAFGAVSLVTVLTNLLLLPFLLPLLVLAGLFLALHWVPLLGGLLQFMTNTLALYCIKVAKMMSALPFALWTAPAGSEKWFFAGFAVCCAAAAAVLLWRRKLDLFKKTGIIGMKTL